jgi:Uma2 family endonuclease
MTLAQQIVAHISAEEYLEIEEKSDVRHEYIAGQLFAMSGASDFHNLISGNLFARLRSHLRGTTCYAYQSGMKIRVEVLDTFYYPNVFVTCEPAKANTFFKTQPSLIIEVLSPSTELTDRREKLLAYFKLESLREYVLISQDERRIDIYRRDPGGKLRLEILGPDDEVQFDSLPTPLSMAMSDVYEDVHFD